MFTYAKLSQYDFGFFRLLGSGLGNLLFPWARSIVLARKYNFQPIWPTWFQIKLRHLLKYKIDKRLYYNLFIPSSNYVVNRKKLYTLLKLPHITEQKFIQGNYSHEDGVIIFEGLGNYFQNILESHVLVKEELLKIIREKHKNGLFFDFRDSLSVHIRLGDFSTPKDPEYLKNWENHHRLPMVWYLSTINKIRKSLGKQLNIYLFSDGQNSELSELLALPNCYRLNFGSSIGDIIALANANILITSGSTFSMWASYLGRMPVIWHPGQIRQRLYYDQQSRELELDINDDIPDKFLKETNNKIEFY
jgi:hypothetical protein